jgi:methyl-accepting chemotaxis protein
MEKLKCRRMNHPWHKEANKIFTEVIISQWIAAIVIGIYTDTVMIGATLGNLNPV